MTNDQWLINRLLVWGVRGGQGPPSLFNLRFFFCPSAAGPPIRVAGRLLTGHWPRAGCILGSFDQTPTIDQPAVPMGGPGGAAPPPVQRMMMMMMMMTMMTVTVRRTTSGSQRLAAEKFLSRHPVQGGTEIQHEFVARSRLERPFCMRPSPVPGWNGNFV